MPFLSNLMGFFNSGTGAGNALLGGLGSVLGGFMGNQALNQARGDIQQLAEFDPRNAQFGAGGIFFDPQGNGQMLESAQQQTMRGMLGSAFGDQLMGGFGNQYDMLTALGQNDIRGGMQNANALLNTMAPGTFNAGQFGQVGQNISGLGNMFAQNVASGPQDFSGGLMGGLFSQGAQNQMRAGDMTGLQNQELATMRRAAAPEMNRQINALENRLFSRGMLGSTGGAEAFRGLMEAQGQQDLGFQQEAFNRAMGQGNFLANLGATQIGQGQNFLGQNLGQFNQNVGNAANFAGLGMGFEGQGFGQGLQALQQNQSAGQQRLQNAMSLFGLGNQTSNQAFANAMQANQGVQGMNQLGLSGILGLLNAEANRIGSTGMHAQGLGQLGSSRGGLLGGLFSGLFG